MCNGDKPCWVMPDLTPEEQEAIEIRIERLIREQSETEMTKVINVNTPWGQYRIPAALVARNRAEYYASKGDDYASEFDYAMDDDYELVDWLLNNMDWADVRERAVKYSDIVLILESDFWSDSEDFWVTSE